MAMMISLTSAVSGLKSQQTALDVIANNIANVNTTAYKSQTVNFSDLLSQTIQSASGATTTTGGTNPSQVGLGVQVASTTTDMTVGSTSTTSNATDVALNGDGYFIVQTNTEGEYEYTRAGNLSFDENGNLNVDGYNVCGWEAYTLDADGNKVYTTTGTVEPINAFSDTYSGNKKIMAAKTTTSADVTGNLDSTADVVTNATLNNIGSTAITDWDTTTTVNVIDEQGNKTEVTLNFKKCATVNSTTSWYWEASATDTTISPSSGYIAFDSDGKMVTSVTPSTTGVVESEQAVLADAIATATNGTASTEKTAVTNAYAAYTAALAAGGTTTATAATIVSAKETLDRAITVLGDTTLSAAYSKYNANVGTAITTAATAEAATDSAVNEAAVTKAIAAESKTTDGYTDPSLSTFAAAITAANATVSTNVTAVSDAYTAYAAALAAGGTTSATAATIVSTKAALNSAIATLGNTTLSTALTAYDSAGGTNIYNAAVAEAASDDATNQAAVSSAITALATADQTTFSTAITTAATAITANQTAVTDAYTAYAAALTAGGTTTTTASAIVSTKTALDSAISALVSSTDTTLATALTTYNTNGGTAINTAATTEASSDSTTNEAAVTKAITAAKNATTTTGYSSSSMTVTTGITSGDYTVTVAAATTGTGHTITLTDPTGKTYTTTSTDGSATFATSSGTVTLAAPTAVTAGTAVFAVNADTAVTFDASPLIAVTSTTNGTNAVPVELDLSELTSTGTTSKLTVDEDGYEAGTLTGSYTISSDGTISASYSNGETQSIGQIALAVFENANGLEKAGGNLYATTSNSGDYSYVVAGENGSGTMTSKALELSNVDLASQFSAMMISQRAYQANSKVMSTSDDMLQSLINMVG